MLQRLTASLEEVSSGDDGTSSAEAAVASVLGQFGERARTLPWRRRIIQERLCADLLRTAAKHATPPAAAASSAAAAAFDETASAAPAASVAERGRGGSAASVDELLRRHSFAPLSVDRFFSEP